MKRFIGISLFLIIFTFIFTACTKQKQASIPSNNETSAIKVYFTAPDRIVIYKNGNTQTISKEGKLFSEIVKQMNNRVDKDIDLLKLAFDKNNMKTTKEKEVVIEFVYSKNQKSQFGTIEKEYNNLIFPLTGENKEFCFFDNNKNHYSGPIGKLKSSNVLLDLLNID